MIFDRLILSACLLPGKYSFEEKKVRISVTPEKDETIILFSINDISDKRRDLRRLLGIGQDKKVCDLIVFYAKEDIRCICFVELKGSGNLQTAKNQVIDTFNYFKSSLETSDLSLRCIAKAYIKLDRSAPQEADQYKKELAKVFGTNNYRISNQEDISLFIRGIDDSKKQAEKIKNKNKR